MVSDERRRAMQAELRARLGGICSHWPPDLFDAMVDELARITVKYDGITSPSTYDRRSTDRLVDDLKAALDESVERRNAHRARASDAASEEALPD